MGFIFKKMIDYYDSYIHDVMMPKHLLLHLLVYLEVMLTSNFIFNNLILFLGGVCVSNFQASVTKLF